MSVAKMVEEFATVTEQEGSPKLYLTLIEEEYKEWQEIASGEAEVGCDTPVYELKELADLKYVIYGFARAKGWVLDEDYIVLTYGDNHVMGTVSRFLNEVGSGSKNRELKFLQVCIEVIDGYAKYKGYDLETAVQRVHENNLGRCIQPDGTIQRRVDGKIIKNENYERVYLEDLV